MRKAGTRTMGERDTVYQQFFFHFFARDNNNILITLHVEQLYLAAAWNGVQETRWYSKDDRFMSFTGKL